MEQFACKDHTMQPPKSNNTTGLLFSYNISKVVIFNIYAIIIYVLSSSTQIYIYFI